MRTSHPPSERDRSILRSFAHRIDASDPGAHNNLGVLYHARGMVAEAVAAFTRALELDARMSVAERNLEIACFTDGYFDRRRRELEQRLGAKPEDADARWELAQLHFLLRDDASAVREFERLRVLRPKDMRIRGRLATACSRMGDQDAAWGHVQAALELAPDDPNALLQLAEVAYHRGLNDAARDALTHALTLTPDNADALYLLGFVLGDMGDHDGGRAAAARALRLNPSMARAQANLSLERLDKQAVADAREAREASNVAAPRQADADAMTHYHLGLAFRQKGYLDEALREYTVALQRNEDPLVVLHAVAEVHLLRGAPAQAVETWERILGAQPSDARAWNGKGVALHRLGKHELAREAYDRALAIQPTSALALNNRGVAAHQAGRDDEARTAFDDALRVDPGCLKARLNQAFLLSRLPDPRPALASYRRVLEQQPEHPVSWNGIGVVLARLRRFDDARNAFGRAIDAAPDYAEAHYNLSFSLSSLGDFEGALRSTRRALELDPLYAPQRLELAIELEYEDPRLGVTPVASVVESPSQEFVMDAGRLDALFDELDAAPEHEPGPGADPYAAARSLLQAGDHERALSAARRAIAARAPRAEGLTLLGDVYFANGATGEALERYREASALDAGNLAAVVGELRALVALHRWSDAIAAAAQATHAPDAEWLLLVATARLESGDAEGARVALIRARRLAPERSDILALHARIAVAERRDGEALDVLREAVALEPHNVTSRVTLAEMYLRVEHHDDAIAELLVAVRLQPQHEGAVLALARLLRDRGRQTEAVPVLADFLLGNPWHLGALAVLGEVLWLAGRVADARFAFARIRKFEPGHLAARYFEGVLLAHDGDLRGALDRWRSVERSAPSDEYAARARRDALLAQQLLRRPSRASTTTALAEVG